MTEQYSSPDPMSDLGNNPIGGGAQNDDSPYRQAAWSEACTWCFIFTDWNQFCSACGDLCTCDCCDCSGCDCSGCDCGTCCEGVGALCTC